MNILITNISTFAHNIKEIEYEIRVPECDVKTIKATHTNESILKCLSNIRQVKETGGIHKIIALVSNAALHKRDERFEQQTAYEYVQKVAKAAFSDAVQFVEVNLENTDKQERDLHIIINDVCSEISEQDVVYMDAAGGKRTISNIMQLLTNMLAYKGIKNALTLYSDIQNTPSFITDTRAFEQMTALMNAFNEFMTTGKSDLLNQYIPTDQSPQLSKLLTTMRAFSNCIRILDIDNLDRIIQDLQVSISEYQNNGIADNIESVIVHQFLPIIQKKLLGDETSLDYLSIIQWCLDNALIQQALTIFESKIPKYLFDKKLIMFRSESKRKEVYEMFNNNKGNIYSFETYALYTNLLAYKETNPILEEAKAHILTGKEAKHPQVKILSDELENFRRYFPGSQTKKFTKYEETDITRALLKFKKESNHQIYDSFLNSLCNNQKKLMECLGILEDKDSYSSKLKAIENIKDNSSQTYKFSDSVAFAKIAYAYIFLKQERNRTNHAISEKINDFTNAQKDLFRQEGFIVSDDNNYEDLCKNTQLGIDFIRSAMTISEGKKEIPITPTELKKDDTVSAKCTDTKKVSIDNHPYEIQMTIPKDYELRHGSFSLIGKNIQVRIKQISKAGKIAQVEFIQIIKQ